MEDIWNTFDELFRTVRKQGQRVTELENKIASLEARLQLVGEVVADREPAPVLALVNQPRPAA